MYPAAITAFVRTLAVVGAFPTRATPRENIEAIVRKLHPLDCGRRFLRLGGAGDGGYLVPDDLAGIAACWSAGVGCDSAFERDCADRHMDVFLADGSVTGPACAHPRFRFVRKFLGAVDDDETTTLPSWMASHAENQQGELLLKLDIEGGEYEVLLAAPEALLARCRVVVVEFHQLDLLWSAPFFRIASRAIGKLVSTHACVHIHPNNHDGVLRHRGLDIPPTMEFTFLRRDRLPADPAWRADFPHPLDRDNAALAPLRLPRCWYR